MGIIFLVHSRRCVRRRVNKTERERERERERENDLTRRMANA